ncbi:MAG: hypothetical protein LBD47_06530, partial [Treponema sp.]|nr:hypothetical protein [Treponema sp.]
MGTAYFIYRLRGKRRKEEFNHEGYQQAVSTNTLQNNRVEPFKFSTSGIGGKMPVDPLLSGITCG